MDSKFNEWKKSLVYTQSKVILPDQVYLDKTKYISKDGFNFDKLNTELKELYNTKYSKNG